MGKKPRSTEHPIEVAPAYANRINEAVRLGEKDRAIRLLCGDGWQVTLWNHAPNYDLLSEAAKELLDLVAKGDSVEHDLIELRKRLARHARTSKHNATTATDNIETAIEETERKLAELRAPLLA